MIKRSNLVWHLSVPHRDSKSLFRKTLKLNPDSDPILMPLDDSFKSYVDLHLPLTGDRTVMGDMPERYRYMKVVPTINVDRRLERARRSYDLAKII